MPESITGSDGQPLGVAPVPPSDSPADAGPAPLPRIDPEAPHGRTKDGTPRRRPGPKGKPAAPAPPPAPPAPVQIDAWSKGLQGYGQTAAGVLAAMGARTGSVPLLADAVAVSTATPPLASALVDLGQQDPRVARVLDRVCSVGPYAALVTVTVQLAAQLAVNHGRIPAGTMGTRRPEELTGDKPAEEPQTDGAPVASDTAPQPV